MGPRFGSASLSVLSDEDLETVYRAVMSKR